MTNPPFWLSSVLFFINQLKFENNALIAAEVDNS